MTQRAALKPEFFSKFAFPCSSIGCWLEAYHSPGPRHLHQEYSYWWRHKWCSAGLSLQYSRTYFTFHSHKSTKYWVEWHSPQDQALTFASCSLISRAGCSSTSGTGSCLGPRCPSSSRRSASSCLLCARDTTGSWGLPCSPWHYPRHFLIYNHHDSDITSAWMWGSRNTRWSGWAAPGWGWWCPGTWCSPQPSAAFPKGISFDLLVNYSTDCHGSKKPKWPANSILHGWNTHTTSLVPLAPKKFSFTIIQGRNQLKFWKNNLYYNLRTE